MGGNADEEGSIEVSLAGLFRCMFCTHGTTSDEKAQLTHIADSLTTIQKKIETIEHVVDPHGFQHRKRTASGSSRDHHLGSVAEETDEDSVHSDSETSTVQREERDFLTNPYWIDDQELKKGEVDFLSSSEIQFWKDLIDKYLYPIDQNKEDEVYFLNKNKILFYFAKCRLKTKATFAVYQYFVHSVCELSSNLIF